MKFFIFILLFLFIHFISQCQQRTVTDNSFFQEYHEVYPVSKVAKENEVRSIVMDHKSNVWIATAAGVFMKKASSLDWTGISKDLDDGPAYSVVADNQSRVW